MNGIDALKQAIAQNDADARAVARATVRDFVERRETDMADVASAMDELGLSVATVETMWSLHGELLALKVPAREEAAKLQEQHATLNCKLDAECARLRKMGVMAIDRRGGWGACRVSPLVKPLFDQARAAKFALDAAVTALARRDELREQIATLLGENERPVVQAPEFKVEINGSTSEQGFVRSNRQTSKRIVRRANGEVEIEEIKRRAAPGS